MGTIDVVVDDLVQQVKNAAENTNFTPAEIARLVLINIEQEHRKQEAKDLKDELSKVAGNAQVFLIEI